jgi:hypothetical protein
VLAQGGSITTYATNASTPEIPYWQLVFINAQIFFIGSDDIPSTAKVWPPLTATKEASP